MFGFFGVFFTDASTFKRLKTMRMNKMQHKCAEILRTLGLCPLWSLTDMLLIVSAFCFDVSTYFWHDYFSLSKQTCERTHMHTAPGYVLPLHLWYKGTPSSSPDTRDKYGLLYPGALYNCRERWFPASCLLVSSSAPGVSVCAATELSGSIRPSRSSAC